jgi:hypothetical protein
LGLSRAEIIHQLLTVQLHIRSQVKIEMPKRFKATQKDWVELEARAVQAEAEAKSHSEARAQAEADAKSHSEARAQAEADLQELKKTHEEQLRKLMNPGEEDLLQHLRTILSNSEGPFISKLSMCDRMIPFVDRDLSMTELLKLIESRPVAIATDPVFNSKKDFPFPLLVAGSGSGKSRFLTEIPEWTLNKTDRSGVFKKPCFINISFNKISPLRNSEEGHPMYALTRRMAHAIHYDNPRPIPIDQFDQKRLNFNEITNLIKDCGYTLLIIGIDEINYISDRDRYSQFVKSVSSESMQLSGPDFIVIPILTGTGVQKTIEAARESTYPGTFIALPLLGMQPSEESIIGAIQKRKNITLQSNKFEKFRSDLRRVIKEIGGHCRSMEVLIEQLCGRPSDLSEMDHSDWKGVIDDVVRGIEKLYNISIHAQPLSKALAASVIGKLVDRLDAVGGGTTYGNMEDAGLIKIVMDSFMDSNVIVPMIFVRILCTSGSSPFRRYFREEPVDGIFWQFWEFFNQNFLCFRILCFKEFYGNAKIKLNNLFPGHWGPAIIDFGDTEIKIPENISMRKLSQYYDKNVILESGTIYSTKMNDLCDGFGVFQTHSGEDVIIALQMKHTNDRRSLSAKEVQGEFVKVFQKLSENHRKKFNVLILSANFEINQATVGSSKIVLIDPVKYYTDYFRNIFTPGKLLESLPNTPVKDSRKKR